MVYTKELSSSIDFGLLKEYYECVRAEIECDSFPMKDFKEKHKKEYGFFSCVARKRKRLKELFACMLRLGLPLYFGTLTFDNEKDKNKIESKRKEAFKCLNDTFEFFVLIEEYGEEKERYHIHFVSVFREGKNFDDFVRSWSCRQNISKIENADKTIRYLCKYTSKQLPRIRTNRNLSRLEKVDKKCRRYEKSWTYSDKEKMNNRYEKERSHILQELFLDVI